MKAMVLKKWGEELSFEEIPDPEPRYSEVIVRVYACAPDQFDVTIRDGRAGGNLPLILGHEIAGEIVSVGKGVEHFQEGSKVVVHPYLTCGHCKFCQVGRNTLCLNFKGYIGAHTNGGYAEYVAVPEENLCFLPDGIDFALATTIVSPVATPLKALKTRAKIQPGQTVLIVGACGGVGIHAVQIAKAFGANVIAVDIDDQKLSSAKDLGADHIVNSAKKDFADEVLEITEGIGADAVLELVGTDLTLPKSFSSVSRTGVLVVVGFQPGKIFECDPTRFVDDEILVTGSRYVNKAELSEAVEWVGSGRIKPVISGTYDLKDAEQALQDLASGKIFGRAPIQIIKN
tara:strand:- start:16445 stop:17476 length:1032 start_codon:yes stop_codon:yes gene_type:complete